MERVWGKERKRTIGKQRRQDKAEGGWGEDIIGSKGREKEGGQLEAHVKSAAEG